jgi:hypothetical protein
MGAIPTSLPQGTIVTLIARGGKQIRRRVWEDTGRAVLICLEATYQQALATEEEPNCSAFPRIDILEVLPEGSIADEPRACSSWLLDCCSCSLLASLPMISLNRRRVVRATSSDCPCGKNRSSNKGA